MTSRRRRVEIPDAGSVLDELYAYRPDPEPEPPAPAAADHPTPEQGQSEPAGAGRRPEGMVRATWYVPAPAAGALSAAADRIARQLGGLVPRHRVLAALIEAAVDQEQAVAARLRAELLATLAEPDTGPPQMALDGPTPPGAGVGCR